MVDVRAVTLEVGCSKFVGRISSTVPLVPLVQRTGGSGYETAYNYRYRNGDHKSWALLSLTRFLLFPGWDCGSACGQRTNADEKWSRLDKVITSPLGRRPTPFSLKKISTLVGSRTNLGTIRKISINKCYK
ncbi:hypothetical protein ALC62_06397 [Cyphomyrmex costatus]|uniref:Uncharacterized protein n=1 Tax=Cyphomyrmex costatus TaxID=456900 RepID=A0A195CRT3_9HYME|nr:hypothetical protein ALC62_06397 [Cyphomyrmex costatus]